MKPLFDNIYEGRTVLVTGHSGFKGSWLVTWLLELGAKVVGFSLPDPPTVPSNYVVSDLASKITDIRGDIRHLEQLIDVINAHQPEFLFHLAAQPIVLESVAEPKATMDTNAGGTVNVLEAVRQTASVKALICVTTDKVYDNQDWLWGYRETDRLGGHDPYSASKSMAELATSSYRDTFFPASAYDKHGVAVASARAGNVIGGGDFGKFRLIPDCLASLMAGEQIEIRNPTSIRPWQLVLESLSG
jgi:CDP-glucose 4,6-dehydratase